MEIITTHLDDVLELSTPRYRDDRGTFSVTFEVDAARRLGMSEPFVQDNHSVSILAGTLRGLHLQLPPHAQGKLVRVVAGRILDVVVDLRPDSANRGRHAAVELDAETGNQLWVPRGFAHGFCTLEPDTEVVYKVDNAYTPGAERSLAWNDPTLDIDWPFDAATMTLADKDRDASSYQQIIDEIDHLARIGVGS